MTVIVRSAPTRNVVVLKQSTLTAVRAANRPVSTVEKRTVNTVVDRSDVTNVAGVGRRGPQGLPGADGSSTVNRVASETLGGHRIVRSTGPGTVGYADCTNASHGDDTQAMTLGAAIEGAAVPTQRVGSITHGGWDWIPGQPVFLGSNGLPTQTPLEPIDGAAFIQTIGHAEAATVLYLQIEPPIFFGD